ncbi:tRNA glutamyl-Q(34) synthetase GluQRS [Magnetospira sp. QH-2]|uniref:tRNA glutamyl-Q(34) synthetase GluQRS n=1 Tax=Magnetospira sp. (strain QH-2) TaxID=1288970 RepID=UPI0003E80A33|nr:tRNA glutamyl-Q(34) synthetase GluQRS [Magnetospira sp. QH-2]CCQ72570.1 Glutamyl-tRNA synthetase [Magnetospira sp. QH-2]
MNRSVTTRFAPSPTGYLHLGHAYSALFSHQKAQQAGGRFLLRMEDIDVGRCRSEFHDAILEDLAWLGLTWEGPVRRQSEHMAVYANALHRLRERALLYPCFCSRREIAEEIAASASAPHGPDGPHYPGTCRTMDPQVRRERLDRGDPHALRLDMQQAIHQAGILGWSDAEQGDQVARPEIFGDVVLARRDVATSYHLSVTVDDHLQGVTLVTRGTDLFEASHVHRLLQALLDLDRPLYHHHRLLVGTDGKRFAKRDKSLTLRALREAGRTAEEVRTMALGQDRKETM